MSILDKQIRLQDASQKPTGRHEFNTDIAKVLKAFDPHRPFATVNHRVVCMLIRAGKLSDDASVMWPITFEGISETRFRSI
jgi:hypothetical protein